MTTATLDPRQPAGDALGAPRACEACRTAAAVTAIGLLHTDDVLQVDRFGRITVNDTAALCGRCLADAHALGLIDPLPDVSLCRGRTVPARSPASRPPAGSIR